VKYTKRFGPGEVRLQKRAGLRPAGWGAAFTPLQLSQPKHQLFTTARPGIEAA
jgi:hypothetical protein